MKVFVKLVGAHFIGTRSYPDTSVIPVEENLAQELVKAGHATPHDGPAFEPEPEPGKPKGKKLETR